MPNKVTSKAGQDPVISEFLQAMAADRGLAANSLVAYERDLIGCLEGLSHAGRHFDNCDADDLRGLLAEWTDLSLIHISEPTRPY